MVFRGVRYRPPGVVSFRATLFPLPVGYGLHAFLNSDEKFVDKRKIYYICQGAFSRYFKLFAWVEIRELLLGGGRRMRYSREFDIRCVCVRIKDLLLVRKVLQKSIAKGFD